MTLVARNVAVRLGDRAIIEDISLACGAGKITGLVGPNGAGKSTLMRALAGLVPLAAGTVLLDGANVQTMAAAERGRHLAYLPQQRIVHWPLAARRVVALGCLPRRADGGAMGRREVDAAVDAALEEMDARHLADRPVGELSGGELARVLFARALAQGAPVILADEPTAGLDPAHALGLFKLLSRLAAGGHTIVVALHDLSLAARFCHEVVMMASGRVAAAGVTSDTLTGSRLAEVFGVRMVAGEVGGVPVIIPVEPVAVPGARRGGDPA